MMTDKDFAIMPVMDVEIATRRRDAIVEFVRSIMDEGTDYGTIPGTDKPTLFKPGAEKLTTFFGLSPVFEVLEKDLDWTGDLHGSEPFFYFQYMCSLHRGDILAGQGAGSCNSWEKKYRFRMANPVCPDCEQETIIKGKEEYGGGWLCWQKKGGCGTKWADGAEEIEGQKRGIIKNDNPQDIVNTIDKMAQKRALVAATLIAVNASEFFTQDLEDMDLGTVTSTKTVNNSLHKDEKAKNGAATLYGLECPACGGALQDPPPMDCPHCGVQGIGHKLATEKPATTSTVEDKKKDEREFSDKLLNKIVEAGLAPDTEEALAGLRRSPWNSKDVPLRTHTNVIDWYQVFQAERDRGAKSDKAARIATEGAKGVT